MLRNSAFNSESSEIRLSLFFYVITLLERLFLETLLHIFKINITFNKLLLIPLLHIVSLKKSKIIQRFLFAQIIILAQI